MAHPLSRPLLLPLAAALFLTACAGIPPARMALPAPLSAATPEAVQGIGAGRQGEFRLGSEAGRFSRGRDRLELFNVLSFDRASTRYSLTRADGSVVEAACRGRQTGVAAGILAANARPFNLECTWQGALAARLQLAAPSVVPGTRAERQGEFSLGATRLTLRSVHAVEGSPLPLSAPIGYLILQGPEPVGAIELNGSTPRLWRPPTGHALREPVTLAALALALLWDPANADH